MVDRADAGILCTTEIQRLAVNRPLEVLVNQVLLSFQVLPKFCPKPSLRSASAGSPLKTKLDEHLVDQVLVVQQTAFQLRSNLGSGLAPARWRRRPVPSHPRSSRLNDPLN